MIATLGTSQNPKKKPCPESKGLSSVSNMHVAKNMEAQQVYIPPS
jgi:hypothetical protein